MTRGVPALFRLKRYTDRVLPWVGSLEVHLSVAPFGPDAEHLLEVIAVVGKVYGLDGEEVDDRFGIRYRTTLGDLAWAVVEDRVPQPERGRSYTVTVSPAVRVAPIV